MGDDKIIQVRVGVGPWEVVAINLAQHHRGDCGIRGGRPRTGVIDEVRALDRSVAERSVVALEVAGVAVRKNVRDGVDAGAGDRSGRRPPVRSPKDQYDMRRGNDRPAGVARRHGVGRLKNRRQHPPLFERFKGSVGSCSAFCGDSIAAALNSVVSTIRSLVGMPLWNVSEIVGDSNEQCKIADSHGDRPTEDTVIPTRSGTYIRLTSKAADRPRIKCGHPTSAVTLRAENKIGTRENPHG